MGTVIPACHRLAYRRLLARTGLIVAAVGVSVAAANFFASMIPIDLGIEPELEPMIVAMHAGASLAALGLLCVCVSRPRLAVPPLRHPLVLAAFAVAVWSALLAPVMEFPLNALLGGPLMGEGALMYAEIAVIMAVAMVLRRFRLGTLVAGGAAAVGALVPALVAGGWARPELFREYTAPFALVSAVLVIAACRRLPVWAAVVLGLATGLPALILSGNRSVLVASALGLLVATFFVALARGISRPARTDLSRLAALSVPVVLVLATAMAALAGYEGLVKSLTSRLYLDRIALEALSDRPWSLLIGEGWGRTSEIVLAHFNASGAVLWDGSWDATQRGYTHLHNLASETVLAAGVPGLIGALAMIAFVPLFARRGLLPVAAGFAAALAAVLSVWFQVAMTVPAVALAAGWLVRPVRIVSPRWFALVRMGGVVFLSISAAASLAASVWLAAVGITMRRSHFPASGDSPVACEALPLDLDRGSYTLASAFAQVSEETFSIERAGGIVGVHDWARLDRLLCAVGRAAASTRSADLLVRPILFRATIAFDPALNQSRARYGDTLATWERALDRFLARAPRRTDLAWFYLSWRMRQGDYAGALAYSRHLLARDAADPVGLWFAGSIYASSDRPGERREGMAMLRRSLDAGIGKIVPVPTRLREEILAASGP